MVVRFEVDGCLPSDRPEPEAAKHARIDDGGRGDLDATLLGALSGLSIGTSPTSITMPSPSHSLPPT